MQSWVWLCNPMDCSLIGSSVHGILQARILEWVAILFSRGSSWLRDWARISCIAGRFFAVWATREAQYMYTYSWFTSLYIETNTTLLYYILILKNSLVNGRLNNKENRRILLVLTVKIGQWLESHRSLNTLYEWVLANGSFCIPVGGVREKGRGEEKSFRFSFYGPDHPCPCFDSLS